MPTPKLAPWQFAALNNPFDHFAMYGGVAVGKSYTGSHFAIYMILNHPDCTGLIGANTYDQLSQATLREFYYWLEEYGLEYVVDSRPPKHWKNKRKLKSYKNTTHVRNPTTGKVTTVFTRVLSDGNPIRGIELTWYWLDETRDTPEETHDVIISRMRESDFAKGLITTTTNGEDWSYLRFVKNRKAGDYTYGSMHVPTRASVELGIISPKYYETMLKSYSPMMALQELEAQHVNVRGGRAYYAGGDWNKAQVAPWGDAVPTRDRPLIIGCDFNFSPAPCVWMVGQIGPPIYGPKGQFWGDCIHWFGEISGTEMSTPDMTISLLSRFPGFFYQIYGDVSGGIGTTSNAGVTDYNQIASTLSDAGAQYSIDYFHDDDKQNPRVKARVENMNARLKNALGEIRMTYDPIACPLFDGDIRMVGWKETTQSGRGKLDDGGDKQRTHASDGAGYATYKLFPPGATAWMPDTIASPLRKAAGLL